MWIISPDLGFLSLTEDANDPARQRLQVRGRSRAHLEAWKAAHPDLIGSLEVLQSSQADYAFRMVMAPKRAVAELVARQIETLDYRNVKGRAQQVWGHDAFVAAMHQAWSAFLAIQDREMKPPRGGRR